MTSIDSGRKRLRQFARALKSCASNVSAGRLLGDSAGNATMLVAFAMPMVIGGGGMAIDFAQFYLWKRELQFANDQAAIAAAWEIVQSGTTAKMNERALFAFRTNEQVTSGFNQEPAVKLASWSGGTDNSVIVTSSATKRLPFTSFFTRGATTVSVSSQAAFSGGATFSSCLVATEEDDGETILIGGNAIFTAKCGIMAVSNSSKTCTSYDSTGKCTDWAGEDAISNNGKSWELEAGTIVTAGTVSQDIKDAATLTGDIVIENQDGLYDPYEGSQPPSADGVPLGKYFCKATGKLKAEFEAANSGLTPTDADYVHLGVAYPGVFPGGITIGCDTIFRSGVYFLKGGSLTINGNHSVTGDKAGVMFVLLDGAEFKLNGGADINLTGMTKQSLMKVGYTEDEAEKLDRMLIFEDPNAPFNKNGNILNGSSNTYLNGAIYTPVNLLNLQGTADVANSCLLIVADKINLTGTLNMTDFCENGGNNQVTTVVYGTVKLVA